MNDKERLEEHRTNINVLEHITPESFKYLYQSLVNQLIDICEEETRNE